MTLPNIEGANHALIPLTRDMFAIVDNDPALLDYLRQFKWQACYKSNNRSNYVAKRGGGVAGSGKTFYMHREVLEFYGVNIDGLQVDHKNTMTLDNRKDNLRPATNQQNHGNKKVNRRNTSGMKGVNRTVRQSGERWHARIKSGEIYKYIGAFETLKEAAIAYNIEALKLHGEFAWLNIIEGDSIWTSHSPTDIRLPSDPNHPCFTVGRHMKSKTLESFKLSA